MKLGKIYKEVLNEGASKILYHFTYTTKLENILNTNKFYLTPTIASNSDKTNGKSYFISFSRTKSIKHGYGTKFVNERSVRIKIDGEKLNYNNKVIPIDYWQYPRTPEVMNKKIGDEMEDRVISNDNEITNASKYIISIDIFIGKNGIEHTIVENAKKLGIKINYFDNKNDFANGNPNKSINPIINTNDTETRKDSYMNFSYTLGALTYKEPEIRKNVLSVLESKFKVSKETLVKYNESIDTYHKKLDYYLRYLDEWNLKDLASSLNNELHNNKSSSGDISRYLTKEIINDLKRNNVNSIKEYLNHKLYIGKKSQTDFNKEFNDKMNKVIDNAMSEGLKKFNFYVYDKNGDPIENIGEYPPVKEYTLKKIKQIKQYTSNYILNNDDMFKLSYLLTKSEIKRVVGDDLEEVNNIVNSLDNIDKHEIMQPVDNVYWAVDDFYYGEVEKMKKENNSQWSE